MKHVLNLFVLIVSPVLFLVLLLTVLLAPSTYNQWRNQRWRTFHEQSPGTDSETAKRR